MDDAGILSGRHMRLTAKTAREKVLAVSARSVCQPIADCCSGLFGDLELDRSAGLLLDDRHPILNPDPDADIADPKPQEVAAPELAVDRELKQLQVAGPLFKLEPNADGLDFSGSQGTLLINETAFVPRGFGKADKE
jgi:hypothetical protein